MHYVSKEVGYYLPLNYNDNKIILLVRDPYWLFAYWEISNEKREGFIRQFGDLAWNNSKPVIKIVNVTQGKTQYIEINDFANNWYLDVNQPDCIFNAEIGRLFQDDFFITLATSNSVHTPNNKISSSKSVFFANYKDLRTIKKMKIKYDLGKYEQIVSDIKFGLSSAAISGISSESFIK